MLCRICSAEIGFNSFGVCPDCRGRFFFTCENCGETNHRNERVETIDGWFCVSCSSEEYDECSTCGIYEHYRHYEVYSNQVYCRECFSASYPCRRCGEQLMTEEDAIEREGLCPSCEEEEEEEGYIINEYDYKPTPRFLGAGFPYLGIEIETEMENSLIRRGIVGKRLLEYIEKSDRIYLKHDGSLINGFEIVSHPASLEYHQEKFPWKDILDFLSNNNCRSHDTATCGLHVHISSIFSRLEEIRMALLVYTQEKFFRDISRRTSKYAKYISKECKPLTEFNCSKDRHEAVNFENDDTIEFRMFRGSLRYETFMARIELVYVISKISQSQKKLSIAKISNDQEYSLEYILNYIKKNKKKYTYLYNYLKERNWICA